MSEVKPVYQVKQVVWSERPKYEWRDEDKDFFDRVVLQDVLETRILYPASVVEELRAALEASQKENAEQAKRIADLKAESAKDYVKILSLKDALSAYGDPDVFADDED